MSAIPDDLRSRVLQVIDRSGLNHGEFAAAIGMDPTKLSKSLSGVRRLTSLELAVIAERGEVTVDWLLSGRGRPPAALAARAAVADADAVSDAVARAEHLDDLWSALREVDALGPPLEVPRTAQHGRMIDQGAELADRALVHVRAGGREADLATDLPGVLEAIFGVNVEIRRLGEGIDGISYQRDDFRLALVANRLPWTRMRFTMAHELGHLLAHDSDGVTVDRDVMGVSSRRQHAEMRANAFAAAFLMPADRLKEQGPVDDRSSFVLLLRRWAVSASALSWRLFSLGLIDESSRASYAGMRMRAAALHGGWLDELTAWEVNEAVFRPSQLMVDAAVSAYEEGRISARPLAAILDLPVDEVLGALTPYGADSYQTMSVEEPVFEP